MKDIRMIVPEFESPELRGVVKEAIRFNLKDRGIDESTGDWIETSDSIGWIKKGMKGGSGIKILAR